MAIIPIRPINWVEKLPRYVRQWIVNERHQSLDEIERVRVKLENPYAQYGINISVYVHHQYEVTFINGYTAKRDFTPYGEDCGVGNVRITGYNEVILPNYWIHLNIMQQPMPEDIRIPHYEQTHVAYGIVAHLLKRGESDPLLLCFARKLVNDASIEDALLPMMLKMGLFACEYTASQICMAAYQAFNEIEREQNNG